MVGRILGQQKRVYTFHELHFFEFLWNGPLCSQLDSSQAVALISELIATQRQGYLGRRRPKSFEGEAQQIVGQSQIWTARDVYANFLHTEAERFGCQLPCDHTPRNLFYIGELLEAYPRARIICMVRDPRDVLLSQKNKWRRRSLGATNIPRREALRTWLNYHPVTISRLWRSAATVVDRFSQHPSVLVVKFEELLSAPESTLRDLCSFVEIDFDGSLFDIPQVGSSLQADNTSARGISASNIGRWRDGGLTPVEIYLCERITAGMMNRWGYKPSENTPNWAGVTLALFWFPFHLIGAIFGNFFRARNPIEAIRRRLL